MNYTKDFGWYYISNADRAPAWSSVEYFYDFMTGVPTFASQNGGIGPYAVEVPVRMATVGDVVQYADSEGDWYHTVIISAIENGKYNPSLDLAFAIAALFQMRIEEIFIYEGSGQNEEK